MAENTEENTELFESSYDRILKKKAKDLDYSDISQIFTSLGNFIFVYTDKEGHLMRNSLAPSDFIKKGWKLLKEYIGILENKIVRYNIKNDEQSLNKSPIRICPRCGLKIIGEPALSRRNSKIEICSSCGQIEALNDELWSSLDEETKKLKIIKDSFWLPQKEYLEVLEKMNFSQEMKEKLKEKTIKY